MTVSHVYPQDSSVDDGSLSIGGCDAVELAHEFGTPAYIVAEDDLRRRAQAFKTALADAHPGPGTIVYASKAFPCTAALELFAEEGLGVDVASGGELHLALKAGFDPAMIVMHGNAKSSAELAAAVIAGVGTIVIDGSDAGKLARIVPANRKQRCLIRVVPGVDADVIHEGILTGHATSKFGLLPDEAAKLIANPPDRIEIAGLHFHLGSQLFDGAPFPDAIATLKALGSFPTYDLGGGMAVGYTRDETPPEPAAWVAEVVAAAHAQLGTDIELLLEPGRALVANAGVTLYTIEDIKRDFVAVDGGMSENLRPMLYGAKYEVDVADRMGDGQTYQVVGKHCESTDVIAREASLIDPQIGDILVTPVTGAYGHAMANNYNGIPRPPVVFVKDGVARAVVRRETYEDLTARDQ
ncbi:MAG: diaminopimelate decarboxylase [Solirubrobacteraceae bacterium]|nr:diaminopimelate decarboxylase [Solirubrobacteraceae bacterium]